MSLFPGAAVPSQGTQTCKQGTSWIPGLTPQPAQSALSEAVALARWPRIVKASQRECEPGRKSSPDAVVQRREKMQ